MDFMTALDIGASGLSAERTNINVISMNLANAKTTRSAEGGPYKRKTVLLATEKVNEPFSKQMENALDRELNGVRVTSVANDKRPFQMVYEPGHPDADADGMVNYPAINVVEEMANLMTAQRGFEANVTSMEAVKAMFNKALEIGR